MLHRTTHYAFVFILILGTAFFALATFTGGSKTTDAAKTTTNLASVEVVVPAKPRIGLQVGHWENNNLPKELSALSWNFGASAGGVNEWEINLDVAERVKALLEAQDIDVDLIPTVVPPNYKADAFIAIHADGNDDLTVTGFSVAASMWSTDGRAENLANSLAETYEVATGMEDRPALSRNMGEYYAFNFTKFEHSIDQTTPAAIIELGFITNSQDRRSLVQKADKHAQGIAKGILSYLSSQLTSR